MDKNVKKDGRRHNGGKRAGAGRKFTLLGAYKRGLLNKNYSHLVEPIVIKKFRHRQVRRIKTARMDIILKLLRKRSKAFFKADREPSIEILLSIQRSIKYGDSRQVLDILFNLCKEFEKEDFEYRRILATIQKPGTREITIKEFIKKQN